MPKVLTIKRYTLLLAITETVKSKFREDCDNGIILFCELYKIPPAKVRSSKPELGIGTFLKIDKESEIFVYKFENGELYEF